MSQKKCVKCGHTRSLDDGSDAQCCPSCGAIYAKVEAAMERGVEVRPASIPPAPTPVVRPASATPERATVVKPLKEAVVENLPSQKSQASTKSCPFCAEEILSAAIKCKHCGEMLDNSGQARPVVSQSNVQNVSPIEAASNQPDKNSSLASEARYDPKLLIESNPKKLSNGVYAVVGFLLCLTGIGAIIGVPLLLYGIFSGSKAKGAWRGQCPKCDNEILWYGGDPNAKQGALQCPTCSVQIVFYENKFVHKPPHAS